MTIAEREKTGSQQSGYEMDVESGQRLTDSIIISPPRSSLRPRLRPNRDIIDIYPARTTIQFPSRAST